MNGRQAYFDRARSWAEDGLDHSARSRRLAWIVAGIAVGAMAFEAVALAMLAPLKTVQPITLLVDRQTGFVQALDPLTPQRISADAALTEAYLAQFVAAREGFDRATIQRDYRRVALWSAGQARSGYLARMASGNPANPVQALPPGSIVSVRVKSVSRLRGGLSLVRFETQRVGSDGRTDPAQPWISLVRFRFSPAPMAFADRLDNPLGFQVTGYRRDAEAPMPDVTPAKGSDPAITPSAADPSPQAPARTIAPARAAIAVRRVRPEAQPAMSGPAALARREVPINQIPMGSPLQPWPSPARAAQDDPS